MNFLIHRLNQLLSLTIDQAERPSLSCSSAQPATKDNTMKGLKNSRAWEQPR